MDSVPKKGTTFTVLFPVIDEEVKGEGETSQTPAKGGDRMLFVDDERTLAKLGEEILGRLGYEVISTTSSMEALALFRIKSDQFDLVITDTTMPDMTGDRLARKLIEIRPDIPIILCTGYSEGISQKGAMAIGVRAFVVKPVVKSVRAETVRSVLDRDAPNKAPQDAA